MRDREALAARAAAAVDVDGLVAAAAGLVRIPSLGGDETPAQEYMADLMRDGGLDVDVWTLDLDRLRDHPHAAWEIDRREALGVVGTLPGSGSGRSLVLNGHVDVVPAGDEGLWRHSPFAGVVEDGHLWGRGALDLKGPLVAALFAVRAVREAGIVPGGPVRVQSVVGEEDGGIGTLAAVLRGPRADGAVVVEPTGLAVAPVQAGCLNFRVVVPGWAAHGAVREEGVSALDNLAPVLAALRTLEAERNAPERVHPLFARYRLPLAISVGTVRGGEWASSVPERVVIEGRMGLAPHEPPSDARGALEAAVAGVGVGDGWLREHPPVVEWWGGRYLAAETPLDEPVVAELRRAVAAETGAPATVEGMTYGADMGLLSAVGGIPTVLFGAGDIRAAHRPDERVAVADLEAMARSLARFIVGFCGTA